LEPDDLRAQARALIQGPSVPSEPVSRDALGAAARLGFELGRNLDWQRHDPLDILLSPYGRRVEGTSSYVAQRRSTLPARAYR
jgi:hypothetical protein